MAIGPDCSCFFCYFMLQKTKMRLSVRRRAVLSIFALFLCCSTSAGGVGRKHHASRLRSQRWKMRRAQVTAGTGPSETA